MKSRVVSLLFVMVILLSAIVGFSACSQGDGSASGKVSPNSEKIIGNAK